MAEKILNTRIQLKYDTLANWNASTFNLKKGEIALVEVPTVEGATLQPVMFKVGVGDKKFSELDWASAKAADVYAWAKKPQVEFEAYVKGLVNTDLLKDYYTKAEIDALLKAITDAASALAGRVSALEAKYDVDKKLSVVISELEAKIAAVDTGVMSVAGANAIKAEGDDAVSISLVLDNSGNVALSQSASGLKAEVDLSNFATHDEIRTDDEIKDIAVAEVARLIDVAGDDETLKNIGALVDYVEENASDIAQLITDVGTANTNAANAVETANNAAEIAGAAKATAEEAAEAAADAVEVANEAKTGAANSAAAAVASATAAAGSADDARASAATAMAEAQDALDSAAAAAGSASAAAASATAADASAVAAAASEVNAAGSAAAALKSANDSAAKAENAATSAAQAANSASQAANKAEAAGVAQAAAEAAQGKAEGAQAAAEAAQSAAEKAKSDANTILNNVNDVATGAQAVAAEAIEIAEEASVAAGNAVATANGAKDTADAAKAVADTALQKINAGTGLKVSAKANNEQTIDIDDTVIFIFDCGNATDKIYE